ncbi:MAG: hypothetical protein A2Z11_00750 [Candidatus Woykebacteria bacterium RBG_16_43_9]|uniref:PEGA domain-containing protein n=1 Tax=Candidatus Woykebacteria bacterium RBG_16_43_9 TaxID=1802596 RepID=A0A1G1WCE6_9BACT|nr:MAG: hypothetical protein A2Z11_00750 [Candidatus Woykebacteria bacterium RBG_16_43_9]
MKKILGIIAFLIAAAALTVGIAFYARGYRPDLDGRSIQGTGLVSIKSNPDGAKVFINDEEKGTTNVDLPALKPGKYLIKITKDGFSTWEKEVEVKQEAVNQIEAVLFPVAPTLRALTFTGVKNPLTSPVGDKIVFSILEPEDKAGIWVLNLSSSPLPSFFTRDLASLVSDDDENKFSAASYEFSPDGSQLLVNVGNNGSYFLLDTSGDNENPKEVTLDVDKLKEDWENQLDVSEKKSLEKLGLEALNLASTLTNIDFSPKKDKFTGRKENGVPVLFDSDPGLAPNQEPTFYNLPKAKGYLWYPDGKHLILVNDASISIMDSDTRNNVTIYTGNFNPDFVAPWTDGSKIVITTSLNTSLRKIPDLYAIELR